MERLRDRGGVGDRIAASHQRVDGPDVGQVDLPVVLRLPRILEPVPGRQSEIGGAHVVPRPHQRRDERAADLPVRAGDEDLHRYVTASATTGERPRRKSKSQPSFAWSTRSSYSRR